MRTNKIAVARRAFATCVAAAGLLLAGCESSDSVSYSGSVSVGYGYGYPYGGYYGYPVYGGDTIIVTPPGNGSNRPGGGDHVSTLPSGPDSGMPPSRPSSAQPRSAPSSMSMSRPTPRPMGGGGRRR